MRTCSDVFSVVSVGCTFLVFVLCFAAVFFVESFLVEAFDVAELRGFSISVLVSSLSEDSSECSDSDVFVVDFAVFAFAVIFLLVESFSWRDS